MLLISSSLPGKYVAFRIDSRGSNFDNTSYKFLITPRKRFDGFHGVVGIDRPVRRIQRERCFISLSPLSGVNVANHTHRTGVR